MIFGHKVVLKSNIVYGIMATAVQVLNQYGGCWLYGGLGKGHRQHNAD